MTEIDEGRLLAQLREQTTPAGLERAGVSPEDMAGAMAHPQARAEVARLMAREARAPREGDPAPDFELRWLANAPDESQRMCLSDHAGVRPVALVFGSYT